MLSKYRFWIVVLFAAALAAGGCTKKKDPNIVSLGLGLDKGKTYTYHMKADIKVNQTVGGQKQDIPSMSSGMVEKIAVAKGGGKDLDVTVTLEKFTMEIPNVPPQAKEQLDKMLAALKGSSFAMTVTPAGKVSKFKGMSEFLDRMASSFATDPMAAQLFQGMKQYLNDEKLKNQFTMTFNFGAGKKNIKPGDSWTIKIPMDVMTSKPMDLEVKYTLKAVKVQGEKRTAQIEMAAEKKYEKGFRIMDEMMEKMAPGLEVYITRLGIKGTLLYDPDKNELLKVTPNSSIDMRILAPQGGGQPMEILQSVSTNVTMELKK